MKVNPLDAILAQNKLMSQQINMISQHLSGAQSSNAYSPKSAYEVDADDSAWTTMKEEPATEELKEIKAQEETGSVTVHVPMKMEEPEDQPYPNMQQEPEDEELAQFLAVLRKLQVNISFAEVLEKNPPSMACLRSLISDKKTLKGDETVLGIQEAQPAKISLEMADKSLKRAYGMVENFLVKVESLYLPADFVILDTGEDRDESIILGRPFLANSDLALEYCRTLPQSPLDKLVFGVGGGFWFAFGGLEFGGSLLESSLVFEHIGNRSRYCMVMLIGIYEYLYWLLMLLLVDDDYECGFMIELEIMDW
ncbi:uncharacterized protein LOC107633666 [Arachis ipaensis]|uniref:uncharacterized protein LOC107633666 n=1 Tax=Arachis ipaensis TaxID=130454 RepID=UPI0007AF1A47|nr:uncharacterized protein LOC107633666 [Arachis ipaensis]